MNRNWSSLISACVALLCCVCHGASAQAQVYGGNGCRCCTMNPPTECDDCDYACAGYGHRGWYQRSFRFRLLLSSMFRSGRTHLQPIRQLPFPPVWSSRLWLSIRIRFLQPSLALCEHARLLQPEAKLQLCHNLRHCSGITGDASPNASHHQLRKAFIKAITSPTPMAISIPLDEELESRLTDETGNRPVQ